MIYLASLFASRELGFKDAELIVTILLLQLVAIPGALFFLKIFTLKGNKFILFVRFVIYVFIYACAFFTTS